MNRRIALGIKKMIKGKVTLLGMMAFICCLQNGVHAQTKVACIGNSVTYGYGIENRKENAYPSQLQKLLGEEYEVGNFGHSGATLLRKGHNPYFLTDQFEEALAFEPDIAVVHLGLNDTDPRNWPDYRLDFESDYSWLIDTLRQVNPQIEIHIAVLTPIFSGHPRFKSGTRDWHREIRRKIRDIAEANKVHLMDFYQPFISRPDLFPDNIHPNQEGATKLAELVYAYLEKDFGGLQMPSVFGDGMVLQRGDSIPVFGQGDPGKKVRVSLQGNSAEARVEENGQWKVYIKDIKTGGPYQLEVLHGRQLLTFTDVMVGEVWLCMGQSNMAFPLNASLSWAEESRKKVDHEDLRLFKFSPLQETDGSTWGASTLQRVNDLSYFEGAWGAERSGFSAVAYHFGKELQDEINVPIGLIQLALGGAPIEAFIGRETLWNDDLLVDMLEEWETSDFIMPWVRGRAKVNAAGMLGEQQRHPFEPGYLYDSGIKQLVPFGINGIIWYQGESNTHNPELYDRLFRSMMKELRKQWGNNELPVYFVQLPGMSRPSWPLFRKTQFDLSKTISNVGMAVTLDLGDSLDVHPKDKKEVGKRLALQALSNSYQKNILANGPELTDLEIHGDVLILNFINGEGMHANGKQKVLGFELLGSKGERVAVEGEINDGKVVLKIPYGVDVRRIRYGFEPFGKVNLVNSAGLPMGTMEYDLKD